MNPVLSRRVLLAGSVALALSAALFTVPALAQSARNRVVMQVSDNDPAKWNLALSNAFNVQKALGMDDVELEIVAYGPGLNMLKAGSPVAARVSSALQSNIKLVACENTMAGMHLQKSDMLPDIGYVPAGVVELMQKQQQGWAYIRP